jgi:hypothetical protein
MVDVLIDRQILNVFFSFLFSLKKEHWPERTTGLANTFNLGTFSISLNQNYLRKREATDYIVVIFLSYFRSSY